MTNAVPEPIDFKFTFCQHLNADSLNSFLITLDRRRNPVVCIQAEGPMFYVTYTCNYVSKGAVPNYEQMEWMKRMAQMDVEEDYAANQAAHTVMMNTRKYVEMASRSSMPLPEFLEVVSVVRPSIDGPGSVERALVGEFLPLLDAETDPSSLQSDTPSPSHQANA